MSNRVVPFDSKVDDDVSYKEQEMSSSSVATNEHSSMKSGGTLLSSMGSVGSFSRARRRIPRFPVRRVPPVQERVYRKEVAVKKQESKDV